MLRAIHEREGRWDEVDPDTEVAHIGNEIGLSEDQSYELFGHLVDEGFVEPGRAYRAGGAMPGSTSRIVGREGNMTLIGDDVRLTSKGRAEIQQFNLRCAGGGRLSLSAPPNDGDTFLRRGGLLRQVRRQGAEILEARSFGRTA